VSNGVVTLKGETDSPAQKELSSEYAKDIKGVKEVKNEMTIAAKPSAKETMGEKIDDASIVAQVKTALFLHHSTSAFKTGVKADNGVVTLTGITTSGAKKDMATKVASHVNGVVNVVNNMTVKN
jgi:osmotically-inducible protein OsmY